jgi:NhaA family Na+:H+ antiporter
MSQSLDRLPREPIDHFTKPFARFLRIEAAAGAVLFLVALCAVGLANSAWSDRFLAFWDLSLGFHFGQFDFSMSLKQCINDGLMTLFFFVVALELKRELSLGELRDPRLVALSVLAALGGMIVPASVYLVVASGSAGAHGWGVVMATDTAFVIGCLSILGSRVPLSLRLFLLSLAIFDDIGAILVVAIGYGSELNWGALVLSGLGLAIVPATSRLGVRSIPIYFLVGVLIWVALNASGIHPTLAGVALGLMTPARGWVSENRLRAILNRIAPNPASDLGYLGDRQDLRRAGIATREVLSPVERLEGLLHPWVAFLVMPLFALANAGAPFSRAEFDLDVVTAIFAGLVFGKPVGVILFSFLAVQLRVASLAASMSWGLLVAGSLLTGIGFTMSLFIAQLAFPPVLLNSAKFGIFSASLVSGIIGLLALLLVTSRSKRKYSGRKPTLTA